MADFAWIEHSGVAPDTTLAGDITAGSTTINLTDGTGYPTGSTGDFYVTIDPGGTEESVKIDSRSGNVLTVASGGRGANGTTATSHLAGVTITHGLTSGEADAYSQHIADDTRDDHSQYLHTTSARTTSAMHIFTGGPIFRRSTTDISTSSVNVYRTAFTDSQSIALSGGNLSGAYIGRSASSEDLKFGFDAGAGFVERMTLAYNGGHLTLATGGQTVSGSQSGYSGGELRLGPTTAATESAISTQATGAAVMNFDHRATANTGVWNWRNGTGGGTTQMALDTGGNAVDPNGDSSLRLRQNNTLKRIGVGAADSGGAGYRVLRVPN